MDKERLFRFIDKKYASKREMYTALPLSMSADELWSEVLENRRSKGVILPIRNAAGQSYWYTLTETMIRASENIVDELLDAEVTAPITSVSPIKEIFFTGYMEGAQISIRDESHFRKTLWLSTRSEITLTNGRTTTRVMQRSVARRELNRLLSERRSRM